MKRSLRSFLFLPANRADFVHKAARHGPHAVILDLEDAVPREQLAATRDAIRGHVEHLARESIAPWVRINALSAGGREDLAHVVCADLAGLILPKAEDAAEVREIDRWLAYHEGRQGLPFGRTEVIVLPETARGIRDAHALAAASPRVRGLMSGVTGPVAADVARAVGYAATPEGLEQIHMQSRIILDSRAADAPFPIAGIVGFQNADHAAIERAIVRARSLGFTGVALVHPGHVAIANRVFAPTAEEIAYCRSLVAAYARAASSGHGAVAHEDVMIDRAMVRWAEQVLEQAGVQ